MTEPNGTRAAGRRPPAPVRTAASPGPRLTGSATPGVTDEVDDPDPPVTRQQLLITIGILTAMVLAALDASVVGTAMPTIIGELGGLSEYSWVFSGYLLAATITVPIFAKLADMYGRRPIFLFGLFDFVAASMLCGFSSSMLMLITFRTLQGLGAGALQPIAFTIVGDIYTPAQRARMQALFSATWGTTAIIGPAIGGIITTTVGWPWVFWINLPIAVVATIMFLRTYREQFERRQHRIDWTGATLLLVGAGVLLFTLSEGSDLFGYASPTFAGLVIASLLLIGLFLLVERRVVEPLIDFRLLSIPVIGGGLAIGTLLGVGMFGITTYVPPLVQGVEGRSAVEAGAAVAAMSIGWPVGSIVSGRLLLRFGTRRIVVVGGAVATLGLALLAQMPAVGSLPYAMLSTGVTGLGMGLISTVLMVSIQGSVDWSRRGVATGLYQFSRTVGGSLGIGLMGGILTVAVGSHSAAVLDPAVRDSIAPAELLATRAAMLSGLQVNLWIMFGAAVAAFLVALRMMPSINIKELRRGEPVRDRDIEALEAGIALEPNVEFEGGIELV